MAKTLLISNSSAETFLSALKSSFSMVQLRWISIPVNPSPEQLSNKLLEAFYALMDNSEIVVVIRISLLRLFFSS